MTGFLVGAWRDNDPATFLQIFADWLEESGDVATVEVIRRGASAMQKGRRRNDDEIVRSGVLKLQSQIQLGDWKTDGYRYSPSPQPRHQRDFVRGSGRAVEAVYADYDKRKVYWHTRRFDGSRFYLLNRDGEEVAQVPSRYQWPAEGEAVPKDMMSFFGQFGGEARRQAARDGTPPEGLAAASVGRVQELLGRTEVPFEEIPEEMQRYIILDLVPTAFSRSATMQAGGHAPGNHVYAYRVREQGGRLVPVGWRYEESYDTDARGRASASQRIESLTSFSAQLYTYGDPVAIVAAVLVRSPGGGKAPYPAKLGWLVADGPDNGITEVTKGPKATAADFARAAQGIQFNERTAGCVGQDFNLAADPAAVVALVGLAKKG